MPTIVTRLKAETEAYLTLALTRLASARREKLSKEDYAVFADGLREYPVDVVQRVCDDLGRVPPEDFQPRFPPLHVIRQRCGRLVEQRHARQRALAAPVPEASFPPCHPEKWAEFRELVRAALRVKVMR